MRESEVDYINNGGKNMSNTWIGRAEPEVELILTRLLSPELIRTQVPLEQVIGAGEYESLDIEIKQHKFDMVVYRGYQPKLIVEVNYKHKEKAARKWRTIFEPMLKSYGYEILLVHDYECDYLFKPQDYSKHQLTWNDTIDVCNALKLSNISFPISEILEIKN